MSESQDQGWFADGLAEEILNTLVRTPDLMVSSRISSFRYRNTELDSPGIAKELGVAHVLEGSVRRAGDRMRPLRLA
jgi:TolB-like protein